MPIQPIDLQTLFTQVDKVGKSEAAQKEGVRLQAAVQNVRIQQKTEEKAHTVNETHDTGEGGAERIKNRAGNGGGGQDGASARKDGAEEEDAEGEGGPVVFRDPDLGRNIDVTG